MEESLRMSPVQIGTMVKDWISDDGYVVDAAGLMNIDFGWAFIKEDYDKTELMRINFGTRF